MLAYMDEWAFDMFEFADVTGQRPLSTLGFAIIKRSGIMSCLKLDEGKLARCEGRCFFAPPFEGCLLRCPYSLIQIPPTGIPHNLNFTPPVKLFTPTHPGIQVLGPH